MKKIILASHGNLAQGMLDSISMLVGDPKDKIEVLTLKIGDSTECLFQETVKKIENNPQDEFILITDVFGGSINNAALQYLIYPNLIVISGMNLGLVLEIFTSIDTMNQENLKACAERAKNGIMVFNGVLMNKAEEF